MPNKNKPGKKKRYGKNKRPKIRRMIPKKYIRIPHAVSSVESQNEYNESEEERYTNEGLERLQQKYNKEHPNQNAEIIRNLNKEKMSEVLLEFGEPLFNKVDGDDLEENKHAARLIIALWNSIVAHERGQEKTSPLTNVYLNGLLKRRGLPNIDEWRIRKKELFPNNKRYVLDFEFAERDDDQFHLTVISTPE